MDLLAFALLALLAGVFVIDVVHDLRGDPPPRSPVKPLPAQPSTDSAVAPATGRS